MKYWLLKKNFLTSRNVYSPQKGRFETRTHEAINKPTIERHMRTALIS